MATAVLLTGNRGYIGSVLTEVLQARGYRVIGYDTDYYANCGLQKISEPYRQIKKDIRDVNEQDLGGVDAIIHLAALSNDPIGELDATLTDQINFQGTLSLAHAAKKVGIPRFVYASSQSMYGIASTTDELDEDSSEKNPITAYARTKWEAECELRKLASDSFVVTCFRPSTVFGASPRLRCDIIFNNFVGCAYSTGKIEIKSDGTPWRPVIHIRDVCSAFIAGLEGPQALVQRQAFNVGIENGNYSVRQLAEAAAASVPGSQLTFTHEHSDSRTYRVSFKKIHHVLKDYFKPEWDLNRGAGELLSLFKETGFNELHFRGRSCNRLAEIKSLQNEGRLDRALRWTSSKR